LVLERTFCLRMVSTKLRMFAEKRGQGTYSVSPILQASFAPRKIVKRRVGAAAGAVARRIMRSKSCFRSEDVYLQPQLTCAACCVL
jgi:hypothetical protein